MSQRRPFEQQRLVGYTEAFRKLAFLKAIMAQVPMIAPTGLQIVMELEVLLNNLAQLDGAQEAREAGFAEPRIVEADHAAERP